MAALQDTAPLKSMISTPTRRRIFLSAARYLAGKAITILITIFIGVLITILIVNYPTGAGNAPGLSPFELKLEEQIQRVVQIAIFNGAIPRDANGDPLQQEIDALVQKLRSEAGLNLPFWPRSLLWTYKALRFDWGELNSTYFPEVGIGQGLRSEPTLNIVLQYFPNTLLLVATAYLLVFLIGMPLSLYMARHYGNRLDRFFSVLSPISSVPSWVFAILLVTIFAVQLRWLPVAGMFDFHKPTEPIPYILALTRHMLLPVLALVLSLLFQLVYTWRTFFIIYSEEDYVDLARAKGLDTWLLEKQHILRPALPYIMTSFATSLIGFWQLTVALEKVFQWPGIGVLYIEALPNYWGESMQVGDLMIVIQIVVIFSYLLGILVFILDLAYVIVDPRIHLVPDSHTAQTSARLQTRRGKGLLTRLRRKDSGLAKPVVDPVMKRTFSWDQWIRNARFSLEDVRERGRLFIQQLRAYPSAIFGLAVIILLMIGSLYALIALPYEEIGLDYDQNRTTGNSLRPKTAAPIWLNLFSTPPRLSTLIMDEQSKEASVSTRTLENGWLEKTITFKFEYDYREAPSDVFLYLDSEYSVKFPFVSLVWITPDGHAIDLKAKGVSGDTDYDFELGVPITKLLNQNPEWKNWFVAGGQYPTPAFKLLFAGPGSSQPTPQRGTYQLKVTSLHFEENSDLKPQLVLLGQVYGVTGTDFWRRDLTVPLLWGMPFTLIIGFLGTLITTLIAMLLPAIGVWFGGWLDNFVQRLTEINMVLPGLAIVVLANAMFGIHIWILLGMAVLLNALGSPIKTFRSAFLQAKEAPYIEMARSYGASNFRIITSYLVPRILPVFIPHLIAQIPSFIFLEATLGFFNIKSIYPTLGRIIYEGLSRGALYGSPFWVLEPIFLLLLTGLAFAMLGSALERILNPRIITDIPVESKERKAEPENTGSDQRKNRQSILNRRGLAGVVIAVLIIAVFIPSIQGKSFAGAIMSYINQSRIFDSPSGTTLAITGTAPNPSVISLSTEITVSPTQPLPSSTPTPTSSPTLTSTATLAVTEPTLTPTPFPTNPQPATYALQKGEYPYCIARRFNVNPTELLALNGMQNRQTFYSGMVLQIPQSGNPFPGERMQRVHPTLYTVSASNETMYAVACAFGDVQPLAIAQTNNLPIDSTLYIGQQLNIP